MKPFELGACWFGACGGMKADEWEMPNPDDAGLKRQQAFECVARC